MILVGPPCYGALDNILGRFYLMTKSSVMLLSAQADANFNAVYFENTKIILQFRYKLSSAPRAILNLPQCLTQRLFSTYIFGFSAVLLHHVSRAFSEPLS